MKYKDTTFTYSTLTRIQRKAVDTFIALDPSLATASSITRQHLEDLLAQARTTDPKFGYPAFVTRCVRVSRGVYPWPSPGAETGTPDLTTIKSTKDIEFEESFAKEMAECGII